MNRYSVIMAGGGGARFWPLSRTNLPKQYLKLSGNDTLINITIRRQGDIIPPGNTFIVTGKSQVGKLREVLLKDVPESNIFVESVGRNTGSCILFAAVKIMKKFGDGVMCVFPSDHFITDEPEFRRILLKTISVAEQSNKLVTMGVKPTFPATGYGYIQYDSERKFLESYEVREFIEKPGYDKASEYAGQGNYLWNSGMFTWKVSVILNNFERFLPGLYNRFMKAEDKLWTDGEEDALQEIYPNLQNISIDHGIMERSGDVVVIPCDFGWNDVGSWDCLGAIFPADKNGNVSSTEHIYLDTTNSIIYGDGKVIATVGLENMIVVSLQDATLVCPKSRAQDVKKIVEILRLENRKELI